MTDRLHIVRIRRAMKKLLVARNYHQQADRMVKDAEKELQQAIKSVTEPEPTGGGERAAA
jgi:hypothetical protein